MTDETTLVEETETSEPIEETTLVEETTPENIVVKPTVASELKSGQTIRVHERIKDISAKGEERERIQIFEGMITGLRGGGTSRTMTIRKVCVGGYAVEKIYPIHSPVISKIELVKTAKVRKAKLSFLSNMKKPFKRKFKEKYEKR